MLLNSYQLHVLQQMELTRQHRLRPESQQLLRILPTYQFWLEHGATTCVLPRCVGKTTLCHYLAERLDNAVFETHRGRAQYNPKHMLSGQSHLVVDEYQLVGRDRLLDLLDREWTSVLLIGSQK